MKNNHAQRQEKPEKLRIRSSVYPEGYGTQEHFNSMWQHAHNEVFKMYREQNLEEKKLQLN